MALWVWIAIGWLAIGFIWTEFLLFGYEQHTNDMTQRNRIIYLGVTVLFWPIPFGMYASDIIRRLKKGKDR